MALTVAYGGKLPIVPEGVFVAPNATLVGDVVLGAQSSVWFGTVLRGDVYPIRVGARTNLQDNSVVHVTGGKARTTIGDDVTVGHLALLHGCRIGSRCLIGMGSVILDDAEIGDECFVAAGSLVPPRMKVPARSFVLGRPAKIVRPVTEAELAQIAEAGALYVGYARSYMS